MSRHHQQWMHVVTTAERGGLSLTADSVGTLARDTDLSQFMKWDGSAWVVFGPGADHGLMGGLGDDDHPLSIITTPLASARNVIAAATATTRLLAVQTTDDDATHSMTEWLDSGGTARSKVVGSNISFQSALAPTDGNNSACFQGNLTHNTASAVTSILGASVIVQKRGNGAVTNLFGGSFNVGTRFGSPTVSALTGLVGQINLTDEASNTPTILVASSLLFTGTLSRAIVTNSFAINANTHNITSGSIVTSHGININEGSIGAGTVGTQFGLKIANMDRATTNYAIQTLGGLCEFNAGAATVTPVHIVLAAAQSENAFEIRNSTPATLWLIEHDGGQVIQQAVVTTGTPTPSLTITSAAHTTLTASTERHEVHWNFSATQQLATGDFALQRTFLIEAPTYSAVGATTISEAATLTISGAPIAGANMTLTNTSALIIASGATVLGEATKATNAGDLQVAGYLTFKEDAGDPTADAGYAKLWTLSDNHLYYQDGDGDTHLIHGPAFSSIWYHGSASTLAIAAAEVLTKITTFVNVGQEDDEGHAVGDVGNDEILLANGGGGTYEVGFGASLTATGAAKELICVAGVELATPLDITNVTDDLVTPIVITSVAHGLFNGDMVEILGVLGNTAANGSFMVTNKANDTFEIVELGGGATTGNGDYNEGAPTGDVTIWYPGCITTHVVVSQTTLQVISSPGTPSLLLANGDKIGLHIANLNDANDVNFSVVTLSLNRLDGH